MEKRNLSSAEPMKNCLAKKEISTKHISVTPFSYACVTACWRKEERQKERERKEGRKGYERERVSEPNLQIQSSSWVGGKV